MGNKIVIKLAQPDGGILAKLGMPFFQALKTNLALDKKGVSVYPTAGPYSITERTIGRHITLKKNKYYKGPRPANIDTFDINVNTNLDQSLLQVKAGQVDYDMGGLPPTAHADLAQQFGKNKGRYFVNPLVETDYVALNTAGSRVQLGRDAAGGEQRHRPPGDAPRPRRVRRPAHRSDPASGHGRLPADEALPVRRPELREGQAARRLELQDGEPVVDDQCRLARSSPRSSSTT